MFILENGSSLQPNLLPTLYFTSPTHLAKTLTQNVAHLKLSPICKAPADSLVNLVHYVLLGARIVFKLGLGQVAHEPQYGDP